MPFVALVLAGCGTPPKTIDEFRDMAKGGGMFLSSETYTVKRPYQQVVDTYKQRAPTCLNQTIEVVTKDKWGTHSSHFIWTTKIKLMDKHMACFMQGRSGDSNNVEVYDPPDKNGHFHFLVDAYPVDQNTTRIVVSKSVAVPDLVPVAAKNWATGENLGCPDMTQ
jgi:hypothetical protein